MKGRSESTRVTLDMPFYRQTFDFSCGPSCLMMAMKYFDQNLKPSKELEIDIWREANLVEVHGTSRFGLALAAWKRDFDVFSCGVEEGISYVDGIAELVPYLDREVLKILYEDIKRRCRRAGIKDLKVAPRVSDIRGWLARNQVPILLVDTAMVSDEVLPHWMVVTGVGRRHLTVNNPLEESAHSRIPIDVFKEHVGFKGTCCAVVLRGKR